MNMEITSTKELRKILLKLDRTTDQTIRMKFIDEWAEFVRTHDGGTWSRLINPIINSDLKEADRVKKKFYGMK